MTRATEVAFSNADFLGKHGMLWALFTPFITHLPFSGVSRSLMGWCPQTRGRDCIASGQKELGSWVGRCVWRGSRQGRLTSVCPVPGPGAGLRLLRRQRAPARCHRPRALRWRAWRQSPCWQTVPAGTAPTHGARVWRRRARSALRGPRREHAQPPCHVDGTWRIQPLSSCRLGECSPRQGGGCRAADETCTKLEPVHANLPLKVQGRVWSRRCRGARCPNAPVPAEASIEGAESAGRRFLFL